MGENVLFVLLPIVIYKKRTVVYVDRIRSRYAFRSLSLHILEPFVGIGIHTLAP